MAPGRTRQKRNTCASGTVKSAVSLPQNSRKPGMTDVIHAFSSCSWSLSSVRSFRVFITNLRLRIKDVVRQGGSKMTVPRNFRLYHFAAILLQIKYKKSEPLADRLQVRISRVWWSIGDSNSCSAAAMVGSSAFMVRFIILSINVAISLINAVVVTLTCIFGSNGYNSVSSLSRS